MQLLHFLGADATFADLRSFIAAFRENTRTRRLTGGHGGDVARPTPIPDIALVEESYLSYLSFVNPNVKGLIADRYELST